MSNISSKGKLFVCGEFSVVYGGEAIIMPVKQSLTVTVKKTSSGIKIDTEIIPTPLQVNCVEEIEQLPHVRSALEITQAYLEEHGVTMNSMEIIIRSGLDYQGLKLGFGSSGVVSVAVIQSVLEFHHINLSSLDLFKLAYLSLYQLGEHGSGGDVAMAVVGNWIRYRAPERNWMKHQPTQSLQSWLAQAWPNLLIEEIPAYPYDCLVGFSGKSHSTESSLIILERFRHHDPIKFDEMMKHARLLVDSAYKALVKNKPQDFQAAIQDYRQWMVMLEERSDLVIETPTLRQLISLSEEAGYAGKVSGAGGGDCGIAFGHGRRQQIEGQWQKHGIIPIDIKESL